MSLTSIKFKKMVCAHDKSAREQILYSLKNWLFEQIQHDPGANACFMSVQEAHATNSWSSDKDFKNHYLWNTMQNHNSCVSFQEIVKSKLAVPKANVVVIIKDVNAGPRKAIPKKIRGESWKSQFGDSTQGSCYCCKKVLDVFDDWHAGHIISHSNGGADTANNLRPVCGSCNLSMGTENMDDFKRRCYPG